MSRKCWGILNNKLVFRCVRTSISWMSLTCSSSFGNKRIKPEITLQWQCYFFLISYLTFSNLDNRSHSVCIKGIFWCPSGKRWKHHVSAMYIISLLSSHQVLQLGEPPRSSRLSIPLITVMIAVHKTFQKILYVSTISITAITIEWAVLLIYLKR